MPDSTPPAGEMEAADAELNAITDWYQWTWGSDVLFLRSSYNAKQLRAIADFLDRHASPAEPTPEPS